jgi:hypothetical protein
MLVYFYVPTLKEENENSSALVGTYFVNIRLDWKGLAETDSAAYLAYLLVTKNNINSDIFEGFHKHVKRITYGPCKIRCTILCMQVVLHAVFLKCTSLFCYGRRL